MKTLPLLVILALLGAPSLSQAIDTASCDGKRAWQREIVRTTIGRWLASDPQPTDLVELIQAEHGIAACAAGTRPPSRLHATTLPRGLELDQLGGMLLANELEWSGLIPRPEVGLVGEYFRVRVAPVVDEYDAPPASRRGSR